MSIALLIETQNEVRRLLIAGSELAIGDFRLKKLLPQMTQAGLAAPVFARVAQVMEKTIEPGEAQVAEKLIELANIINAILYTQGQTGMTGELEKIQFMPLAVETNLSFRKLKPLVDALTTKGSGRLEIIREAYESGVYKDLRIIHPLIHGLNDGYSDISDLVTKMLETFGEEIIPLLKSDFDLSGGKAHARRLDLIAQLGGNHEKSFILKAIEEGKEDVRLSGVNALKYFPECENTLLDLTKDKRKEIREASLLALSVIGTEAGVKRLYEMFNSKEREIAITPVKQSRSPILTKMLLDEANTLLDIILKSEKGFSLIPQKMEPPSAETIDQLALLLSCLEYKKDTMDFLKKCMAHNPHLQQFKFKLNFIYENNLGRLVARNILLVATDDAYSILDNAHKNGNNGILRYSFEATLHRCDAKTVFDRYAKYLKKSRKSNDAEEILSIMDSYIQWNVPFESRLRYGTRYGNALVHEGDELIQWDQRWLKVFTEIDEIGHVCCLIMPKDKESIQVLLGKLESCKEFNNVLQKSIIRGLIQAEYPEIIGIIRMIISHNSKKEVYSWEYYFGRFTEVLGYLPSKYANEIEQLANELNDEKYAALYEVANKIKNH